MLTISPRTARRLFIHRQGLAGERGPNDANGILSLVERLGCLQLDPTSAVARSHLLVLWSRLGNFDRRELDRLLWERKDLFEYWAHAASIVVTADHPIHEATLMRTYPGTTAGGQRVRAWIDANKPLRDHILRRLRREGPLPSREIEDLAQVSWASDGWTAGRNVDRMLTFMWTKGQLCVAGRDQRGRLWALAKNWLPLEPLADRRLRVDEATRQAVVRSLRALGVGTQKHISEHFIRGRYRDLPSILAALVNEGVVLSVRVGDSTRSWDGQWYIHRDDVALADRLSRGAWGPRTTLLSPFDNLICNRQRTAQMFGFDFRLEIYVPKNKRRYGYFVMPVLHGDRLIARLDPVFDRKSGILRVKALHHEGRPTAAEGRAIHKAARELALFLGGSEVVFETA